MDITFDFGETRFTIKGDTVTLTRHDQPIWTGPLDDLINFGLKAYDYKYLENYKHADQSS